MGEADDPKTLHRIDAVCKADGYASRSNGRGARRGLAGPRGSRLEIGRRRNELFADQLEPS